MRMRRQAKKEFNRIDKHFLDFKLPYTSRCRLNGARGTHNFQTGFLYTALDFQHRCNQLQRERRGFVYS